MSQLPWFDWPRWAQMWAMAACMYAAAKLLMWRNTVATDVPPWTVAAYVVAWPGMDPRNFVNRGYDGGNRRGCPAREWRAAIGKLSLGVVLLFGGARLIPPQHEYLTGWIGGAGLVLMLHFGLFHLLSCAWRHVGIGAQPLMNRPLLATSLADFWGRRWNTAFRDLTHRLVFRPCATRFGSRPAALIAFLMSGLVHELAISIPAGGGYGRPTVYFAIQGAMVTIERSDWGGRHGWRAGWRARTIAAIGVLAPAPLLFPHPFMVGVIVPFMHTIGSL
jgi:hypothetical protein